MEKRYADINEVMYHVGFAKNALHGAVIAVLPGDPGRVQLLAENIGEQSSFIACHREYTSWLTFVDKTPILVCSTGMGGPSTAICLEELARLGITHVIRVGTTGTIQQQINPGEIIINKASVRLDGTSRHYAPISFPAVASFSVTGALVEAAKAGGVPFHVGIAVSSDTFWPGQERYDSFTGYVPRQFQGTMLEWQKLGALNYEMETSALFVTCQALEIKAGAVCGVVAQRTDSEAIVSHELYVQALKYQAVVVKGAIKRLTAK